MEDPMNRIGWLALAALLFGVGACSGAPASTSGQGLNGTNVDRGLVGATPSEHDGDAEHEDAEAEHEHGDAEAEREDAEAEHEDAEAEHESRPDADSDHGGRGPH
jgi:hypothetical protein